LYLVHFSEHYLTTLPLTQKHLSTMCQILRHTFPQFVDLFTTVNNLQTSTIIHPHLSSNHSVRQNKQPKTNDLRPKANDLWLTACDQIRNPKTDNNDAPTGASRPTTYDL